MSPVMKVCSRHQAIVPVTGCERCKADYKERERIRRRGKPQRKLWNSRRWQRVRDQVKRERGGCEACGSVEKLSVHHVIPVDPADPLAEIGFAEWNLVVLCKSCHGTLDGRRAFERRRAQRRVGA